MRKLQIFLFIEILLFGMALITILAEDFSRFILLTVLVLLLIFYYFGKQKFNFLLVLSSILLFFIIMLNPYVILAVLVALLYVFIEACLKIRTSNEETYLRFKEDLDMKQEKNPWFGDLRHFDKASGKFDDIHLVRMSGRDVIHLENVILTNHDNVIMLHKGFGNTKIIVPVDVAVCLKVNCLYGDLQFFEREIYPLRNESLSLTSSEFHKSSRSVKIVLSTVLGNVEVVRK